MNTEIYQRQLMANQRGVSPRILVAAVVLIASLDGFARADVTYEYIFGGAAAGSATSNYNYVVGPSGTVQVYAYLQETLSGMSDTSFLNTEGLFGAGVGVRFDDPPLPPGATAKVTDLSNIVPNSNFTGPSNIDLVVGSSAGLTENVGISPDGVGTTQVSPLVYRTYLGSFTFTAGATPSDITHIRATDFDIGSDDNITNNSFTVLDGLIADGLATISVTAVPEPGTLLLLGMTAAMSVTIRGLRSSRTKSLPRDPESLLLDR